MSYKCAFNFDQWKAFSENYKPMRVWLWLVYKFTENYCHSRLFSEFIQTQKKYPISWQNTYPNLKTICYIKLKLFLWTKLMENLLLAKYLISVTAPLINLMLQLINITKYIKIYIKIYNKIYHNISNESFWCKVKHIFWL